MLVLAKAGIGALLAHTSQPLGMHEPPIGNKNIPCGDGCAIKLFAAFFIGQCEKAEPFGGKVECAVDPPQAIVLLRGSARFWHCRAIDEANAPAMRRQLATEQLADQMFEPGLAIAQTLQQCNVGKVRKLDGRRPGTCRAKPHPAQAIGQHKPQEVAGGLHRPWPKEGARLAGASLDGGCPPKPGQCAQPKVIEKRLN